MGFKLRLDVVVGRQDTVHVLLGLFLGFKKTQLGPVDLVFQAGNFLLKVSVLSGQEILILIQKIDLAPKSIIVSIDVVLGLASSGKLAFEFFLLTLKLSELVLKLANLLFLAIQLTATFVKKVVLGIQLLEVSLKVEIASFKS